jgi:hypothetical protein
MNPDPAWLGRVTFYELLFGAWLAYITLVLLWERVLRAPKPEWQYVFMLVVVAGAFLINHYFEHAPLWIWLINGYAIVIYAVWYLLLVHTESRSVAWQVLALLAGLAFTVAFSLFEFAARFAVERGVHEFWFVLAALLGFSGVAVWRGRSTRRATRRNDQA